MNLPGIKSKDLRPCALCGKRHTSPVFYRVTVEQAVIDQGAVQRHVGLAMQIGALADALGPDEDMAKIVGTQESIICSDCFLSAKVYQLWGE